ncbi:putative F-box protein [Iris pallida]|uniref:F-box protein n=1 Tax=Iris pallida TaxID=29817 RepID=A0AAX6G353_IRIPA|nr:putative F-box protein [Iris pallida]
MTLYMVDKDKGPQGLTGAILTLCMQQAAEGNRSYNKRNFVSSVHPPVVHIGIRRPEAPEFRFTHSLISI